MVEIEVSLENGATLGEDEELQVYILQLSNGKLQYTDACSSLIDVFGVSDDGQVEASLMPGVGQVPISQNASAGVYYVVVYYRDQYDVVTLKITED